MPSKSTETTRPGTKLRGELAKAYDSRGKHKSILYSVYSIKAKKDFALLSYIEYLHFIFAESDPGIANISYTAEKCKVSVLGSELVSLLDATVQLKDGRTQWREAKNSTEIQQGVSNRAHLQNLIQSVAAQQSGVSYVRLTENEICAQPHRLRNWNRIIPLIAQARDWPLVEERESALKILKQKRNISYGELYSKYVDKHGPQIAALHLAATFELTSQGKICSDLDASCFTYKTRLWLPED